MVLHKLQKIQWVRTKDYLLFLKLWNQPKEPSFNNLSQINVQFLEQRSVKFNPTKLNKLIHALIIFTNF